MNLEDQVVSLDLAREMNELGVRQDSLWCWIRYYPQDEYELTLTWDLERRQDTYAAFTVAELGEMLPASTRGDMRYYLHMIKTKKTKYYNQPDYYIAYVDISNSHYLHSERDDKEADARASCLIYMHKEGIVNHDK